MKKNELVIKVIEGGGVRTAAIRRVMRVVKGVAYLGDATKPDDVNAYDVKTGRAKVDYIPGFSSYLVQLDDGESVKVIKSLVD